MERTNHALPPNISGTFLKGRIVTLLNKIFIPNRQQTQTSAVFLNCDKRNETNIFIVQQGLKCYGLNPTLKIQTLPEDGSSIAGLKMIPENKMMKQVIPFAQNMRLMKKTCAIRGKTENHYPIKKYYQC